MVQRWQSGARNAHVYGIVAIERIAAQAEEALFQRLELVESTGATIAYAFSGPG